MWIGEEPQKMGWKETEVKETFLTKTQTRQAQPYHHSYSHLQSVQTRLGYLQLLHTHHKVRDPLFGF